MSVTKEQINKVWHIYTVEECSAAKRNKVPLQITAWTIAREKEASHGGPRMV